MEGSRESPSFDELKTTKLVGAVAPNTVEEDKLSHLARGPSWLSNKSRYCLLD
jgi:hypothetical protein